MTFRSLCLFSEVQWQQTKSSIHRFLVNIRLVQQTFMASSSNSAACRQTAGNKILTTLKLRGSNQVKKSTRLCYILTNIINYYSQDDWTSFKMWFFIIVVCFRTFSVKNKTTPPPPRAHMTPGFLPRMPHSITTALLSQLTWTISSLRAETEKMTVQIEPWSKIIQIKFVWIQTWN